MQTAVLGSVFQDMRYGIRLLKRSPGFCAVVILTLGLGIGANTAIFSVVDGVLLRPLPYPQPDRLVRLWESNPEKGNSRNVVNPLNFLDWRDRNHSFTHVAAIESGNVALAGAGNPIAVPAMQISPDFFSLIGAPAYLGRTFVPEDGKPGAANSVVISYGLWKTRFAGNRSVLGKTITIKDETNIIVGVMPPGFSFPNTAADMWMPLSITRSKAFEDGRYLGVIARLKPGVTLEMARQDMARVADGIAHERPDNDKGWSAEVIPMRQDATETVRLPLLVLLVAVGFVLLVACANLANLLLMRGTRRMPELAVRAALGAGKLRLLQQLLSEALLLALGGWVAGLLAAHWGLRGLIALLPQGSELPRMQSIQLDAHVLLFSFAIAISTVLLFALIPAFRIAHADVQGALKTGSLRTGVGVNRAFRYAFVIAEVALSLLLLSGAGLMLRSFAHLLAVAPGFAIDHVLTMNLFVSPAKFGDTSKRALYVDQVLNEVRKVPGVQAAGSVHFTPLEGMTSGSCFSRIGEPLVPSSSPGADFLVITSGYFDAMRMRVRAGRDFGPRDNLRSPSVIMINQAFAHKYFARENPIGQKLNVCWTVSSPAKIVGVVSDARQTDLETPPKPTIFLDNSQAPMWFANLFVRTRENPNQMARSVIAAVRRINPDQAVSDVRTMEDVLSSSVARPRLQFVLLATFAAMALLLAGIGVYGVLSYSVVQRTQEITIRMALGAKSQDILTMILREAAILVAVGTALGVIAALLLTGLLKDLVFQVQPSDPVTLASVVVILLLIALAATLVPVLRARRVDPMVALRYE